MKAFHPLTQGLGALLYQTGTPATGDRPNRQQGARRPYESIPVPASMPPRYSAAKHEPHAATSTTKYPRMVLRRATIQPATGSQILTGSLRFTCGSVG